MYLPGSVKRTFGEHVPILICGASNKGVKGIRFPVAGSFPVELNLVIPISKAQLIQVPYLEEFGHGIVSEEIIFPNWFEMFLTVNNSSRYQNVQVEMVHERL